MPLEHSNTHSLFRLFDMQPSFHIDKSLLKSKYFEACKRSHPDLHADSPASVGVQEVNRAYQVLMDDFSRAKLFTTPAETLGNEFLEECIKLEERITEGENMKEYLKEKVKECRSRYREPEYVAKWAYYKRLLDRIQ